MMKISLIIGAGQIGSRHLQGILKSSFKQKIYVYDLSDKSLNNCKLREKEIDHNNKIIYTKVWNELPTFFDLIVISTNANIRYTILQKVVKEFNFKNIILEKVLFQSPDEYSKALDLINNNQQSNYWVNLPRRQSIFYNNLKKRFDDDNAITSVNIYGEDWGLACNSIHFIDLISFLSNYNLKNIETSLLDEKIVNAKREKCIEFHGSINAKYENGILLQLISLKKITSIDRTIFIAISTLKENIFISEGECANPNVVFQEKTNPNKVNSSKFQLKYQSELSAYTANDLFENDYCSLPSYEQAYSDQKILVESLLKKYNKIRLTNELVLPIT